MKKYLTEDEMNPNSSNDFGKNIIPTMLANGEKMMSWKFSDYWKDVGTISSLWEANMDLIDEPPKFNVKDRLWNIYSRNKPLPPHYIGVSAKVSCSTISEGCAINGTVHHSVISAGVTVCENAVITDSVIMSGAKIGKNVVINKAVIGPDCVIGDNVKIGVNSDENNQYASPLCTDDIVLLEGGCVIADNTDIPKGSMIEDDNA